MARSNPTPTWTTTSGSGCSKFEMPRWPVDKGSIVDEIERKRLLAKINEHTELAKANRDDEDYEDAIEELQLAIAQIDRSSWNDEPSNGIVGEENEIASRLADCLGMLGGNQRR